MNRLRQIIFNSLTMLSILLCLTIAGLWARSYWSTDVYIHKKLEFRRVNGTTPFVYQSWHVESTRGGVSYRHLWTEPFNIYDCPPYEFRRWQHEAPADFNLPHRRGWRQWSFGGVVVALFGQDRISEQSMPGFEWGSQRIVRLPYWLMCFAMSLLPAGWLKRVVCKRRARDSGTCAECGYDLRATPERCPECGTISATAKV